MKYDDYTWHWELEEFPDDSPGEFGATHIALFLRWCFQKGWVGELHLAEEPKEVERVIRGTLSATEFFLNYCDGKLTEDSLNEEGNAFARQYYGDNGLYLVDLSNHFGDLLYSAPESAYDFAKLSRVIEERHRSGVLTSS